MQLVHICTNLDLIWMKLRTPTQPQTFGWVELGVAVNQFDKINQFDQINQLDLIRQFNKFK